MLPCEWVFNFAATCVKIRAARNAKKYIAIILTDTAIAIWSAIVIFAFHFHWKKMKMMWFLPKQACSLTCRTWFVGWGISTEPQCFIYSSVLWHISAFSLKKMQLLFGYCTWSFCNFNISINYAAPVTMGQKVTLSHLAEAHLTSWLQICGS